MRKVQTITLFAALVLTPAIFGQPARMEIPQVFGECFPQYAAKADSLELYTSPNLESRRLQITYKEGWLIPYLKSSGVTRVIETGQVRASSAEVLRQCDGQTESGLSVQALESVDYLYYLGEGYARVRAKGLECAMFVDDDEVVRWPVVQVWLRVLFSDGTSPGWLLHDGSQTKNARLVC